MIFFLLSAALAQDSPSWVAALFAPDAPRPVPTEQLLQWSCRAGDVTACEADGDAMSWLRLQCDEGLSLACLGLAWAQEPDTPHDASMEYRRLCLDGDLAACAEQGRTMWSGAGPWHSRRTARRLAEESCAGDVLRGCTLSAGIDAKKRPQAAWSLAAQTVASGGYEAALVLYAIDPERSLPWLEESCAAGVARACEQWALELPVHEAHPRLERACFLGSDHGCVRAALADPSVGEGHRVSRLDMLCTSGVGEACAEARWLRAGSPPNAYKADSIDEDQARMALEYAIPWMRDCAREALDEGTVIDGWLDLDLWGDADGVAKGLAWRDDPTGTLSRCANDALHGQRALPLARQSQIGHTRLEVHHRALVGLLPDHADDSELVGALRREVAPDWGRQAQQCYLDHGGSAYDNVFAIFELTLDRSGAIRSLSLFESSSLDGADDCLADIVRTLPEPGPLDARVRMAVRFDLNHIDLAW